LPKRPRLAWRTAIRLVALVVTVCGLVLAYETHMLDSWQAMTAARTRPAPGAHLAFTATAYCKGHTTATGVAPRTGIAAADPALLPPGSVLNVATGDITHNGVYTVMDTGPKIQGRILDLYMWSCHDAQRFGRKNIQVTVLRLGWDPRASSPGLIDRLFRGREARRTMSPPQSPPLEPPPPEPPPPADPSLEGGDNAPVVHDTPSAELGGAQTTASPTEGGVVETATPLPPAN
jgi:3D (Asp-Asp-Asp) domain-containing protein